MSDASRTRPVCVVAGVGPGNGEAFARGFASQGYAVALLARRKDRIEGLAGELNNARAYACDLTDAVLVGGRLRRYRSGIGGRGNLDLQRR